MICNDDDAYYMFLFPFSVWIIFTLSRFLLFAEMYFYPPLPALHILRIRLDFEGF